MRRSLFCLVFLAILVHCGGHEFLLAQTAAEKPVSLTLKDMQGKKAKLSDLRGKIVVLNFWATWCGPCNAEMPMVVTAANTYAGENVAFIGVSVDAEETQGKIGAFVQKLNITYPIWTGATDVDMQHLQIGNEVPATLFLDEQGIVRARILGQLRPGELEERVDWLQRNRQGDAPSPLVKHLDPK